MRKALFWALLLVAVVLGVELPAAWLHWLSTRPSGTPFVSVHLVRQGVRLVRDGRVRRTSVPSPLFVAHPRLGYTIAPGRYAVRLATADRALEFTATVLADSTRATAPAPRDRAHDGDDGYAARPAVLVFGDSYAWGWGVDDEATMPWLVQSGLPAHRVVNLAQNGYGNLHALVQMEARPALVRSAAHVVVVYGDYFDRRNLPAPGRLDEFRMLRDSRGRVVLDGAFHPTATLAPDGSLRIGRAPLGCGAGNAWCDREPPSEEELHRTTAAILARMRALRDGPATLAVVSGPDDSPVVAAARRLGFAVCDLRPRAGLYEWDDLAPFDPHPAPLAHAKYARKLLACLRPALAAAPAAPPG